MGTEATQDLFDIGPNLSIKALKFFRSASTLAVQRAIVMVAVRTATPAMIQVAGC